MDPYSLKFKYRLGLFITGGLTLLVLAIFLIGKQKNLFDPVFKLTTTFSNVSGLQVGNNVRFSGINIGTVDDIIIVNDTTVRVGMMIKKEIWQFIKTDCKVTLGSDGIMGDKLMIISPGSPSAKLLEEGQSLVSVEPIETSAIIAKLDATVMNAEVITHQLSEIAFEINQGHGTISRLIQDSILSSNLNQTIANLNLFSKGLIGSGALMTSLNITARNSEDITLQLAEIMAKINRGDGTLGRLIQDSTIADNLNQIILNFKKSSTAFIKADTIMANLNITAENAAIISKELASIMVNINEGNGTIGRLIRDTILADNLNQTLINLKRGSKGLDENMTAVKHNFFFRGYYEKKTKELAAKKDSIESIKNKQLKLKQ